MSLHPGAGTPTRPLCWGQAEHAGLLPDPPPGPRAEVFQEIRYPTKKAAFWPPTARTRTIAHADYGDRAAASRVAAELAPSAGLQAGTARSYAYAELEARAEMNGG